MKFILRFPRFFFILRNGCGCRAFFNIITARCSPFQRLERKFYWPEHMFHSLESMFHPVEPRNLRGITDAGKEEKTGNPSSGAVHPQQRSRCQEQERLGYFPSYSRLNSPPAFERTDMNTKRGGPCGPPLCFFNVQRNNKRRDSGFRDVTLRHKRNPNC